MMHKTKTKIIIDAAENPVSSEQGCWQGGTFKCLEVSGFNEYQTWYNTNIEKMPNQSC